MAGRQETLRDWVNWRGQRCWRPILKRRRWATCWCKHYEHARSKQRDWASEPESWCRSVSVDQRCSVYLTEHEIANLAAGQSIRLLRVLWRKMGWNAVHGWPYRDSIDNPDMFNEVVWWVSCDFSLNLLTVDTAIEQADSEANWKSPCPHQSALKERKETNQRRQSQEFNKSMSTSLRLQMRLIFELKTVYSY